MSLVLFVLGVVMAAAGILMIGFGIPINEFSLGNTLIISGTCAVTGGVIVLGLAAVVRQLKAMSASEEASFFRGSRQSDADAPPRGPAGRGEAPSRERFAPPREDDVADEAPPPGPPPGFGDRPEPAPPRAARAPGVVPPGPSDEREWEPGLARAERPRRRPPPPRSSSPDRPGEPFEAAWPDSPRGERPQFGSERSSSRTNGEAPSGPKPAGPVTILKSGVVDGMAYTLYTDGSIEAELAQGVVRFGSIEELRNHLEKNN
jgi:hypothetical protein